MTAFAALAVVAVVVAAIEIALPGRAVYHYGWFNVALAALVVAALLSARRPWRAALSTRARLSILAIAFGAAVAGLAAVASGLLGPDDRTVVGAPGTSVRVDELGGVLAFPFAGGAGAAGAASDVELRRPGRAPVAIGAGARNVGSFALRALPREVAYVEAHDARGGRLTITQPTGSAFLSPVLLMQQHQLIASTNFDVPFDAFAIPAAHRLVKAVMFSPAQAAMLHPMQGIAARAILFAVDDENDRPLPNAIVLARDGESVPVAGVTLRAELFAYPAIQVIAVPSLLAVAAAALLVAGGLAAGVRRTHAEALPAAAP